MVRQGVTHLILKSSPIRIPHPHIVITRVVSGSRDVPSEIVDGILVWRFFEAAQSVQDLDVHLTNDICNVLRPLDSMVASRRGLGKGRSDYTFSGWCGMIGDQINKQILGFRFVRG